MGFDGPSKVMVMNSSNQTEWPGWSEPTVQLNVVHIWLGSDSILSDKFILINSDIADPWQNRIKERISNINLPTIFGGAKYG